MAGHSSSAANSGLVAQAVHAGANFTVVSFKSAASKNPFSGSVSDSIHMLNLPRNAKIIAAWLGGMCQDGNMGFSLGDPSSNTRFGTKSISATTVQQAPFEAPIGTVFSVSDDQSSYPLTLHLQNATSVSGSMSVHVGVLWVKV